METEQQPGSELLKEEPVANPGWGTELSDKPEETEGFEILRNLRKSIWD